MVSHALSWSLGDSHACMVSGEMEAGIQAQALETYRIDSALGGLRWVRIVGAGRTGNATNEAVTRV